MDRPWLTSKTLGDGLRGFYVCVTGTEYVMTKHDVQRVEVDATSGVGHLLS